MAMNRQTRRQLRRQGEMSEDGAPTGKRKGPARTGANPAAATQERTSPAQFVREVRGELRKVVWPTRDELVNYSIVVLITIVVLTSLIAGLDYLTGEGVLRLFDAS